MSASGWYPDPGGAQGRFRYWDGGSWSDQTTADPHRTPPPVHRDDVGPSNRGGGKGWVVALVVLAIITGVVVVMMVWGTGGLSNFRPATEDTNSSTPTVSAWDETSTPTPSTPPPPTDSGGQLVTCPETQHRGKTTQVPGLLTADTLSVSQIPGWDLYPMTLQSVYDVQSQTDEVYYGWMSNIAVGLLSNADGFVDISTSAEQMMQCFASSGYYKDFTGRTDTIPGKQISVSGHPAWYIQSEIFVSGQEVPGDVVDIVVVDLGSNKDHLGIFFSSCSIGDDARCAKVQSALATLAVNG
ncbi:MAG: DUF2510 domain-containing protein [Propionibacteriaceae bacterium]|nr:DUF2510 domain-containing protein [Propionibacteriaceae bacterium]